MWTQNGGATLPFVLKRIDEVIPNEFVNNRLMIDDSSVDSTREIGKAFGWKDHSNSHHIQIKIDWYKLGYEPIHILHTLQPVV